MRQLSVSARNGAIYGGRSQSQTERAASGVLALKDQNTGVVRRPVQRIGARLA
ncbi:MAG: hypothetical protein QGI88_06295 [SAR202 cluster bacterium]|nr:hypothetical protein [SAR202 cluster bacterium]MDP7533365.1 hypothetical protein [SAR202 cluster bacterium]